MESQNPFFMSVEYFQSEYFPLKNSSSFKFGFLNMITICFYLAHSFKTMARNEPVAVQAVPPCTVQAICSGRGGEYRVWFTRCVGVREPEIYELWNFAKDRNRKVHPFSRIQIIGDFARETFHTNFVNAKRRQVDFLGQRSVNGSVQWLDVP